MSAALAPSLVRYMPGFCAVPRRSPTCRGPRRRRKLAPGSYTRPAKYFSAWWTAWVRGEGSRDKPRCLGRHRCRCVVVQEAAGLVLPQPGVGSVEAKQLLVRALLGDLAAFEHDQLVHARDRAQPMRDHERGPALHQPPQRPLDKAFALRV